MLVGSHGVLARSESTAHGAQMTWGKADGECGQRGGGPFCLAFKSFFLCYLIPCDLIPANNWICTTKEPWKCSIISAGFKKLSESFSISQPGTNLPNIQTHFYTNRRLMNILIRSCRTGKVEGYILAVSEADWNPATQQMCFYCKSDPVVRFKKRRCRVLVLTSKLSPGNLLLRLPFRMPFNAPDTPPSRQRPRMPRGCDSNLLYKEHRR